MPKSKKTVTIYGIPNCDSVKKARTWLDERRITYRFHDFRAEGVDREWLEAWVQALGWETVLNKSSTTFKHLPEEKKVGLTQAKATVLMLASPTMIKRPVLDLGLADPDGRYAVGFKPDAYKQIFAS